jgi:hypothetical protein
VFELGVQWKRLHFSLHSQNGPKVTGLALVFQKKINMMIKGFQLLYLCKLVTIFLNILKMSVQDIKEL